MGLSSGNLPRVERLTLRLWLLRSDGDNYPVRLAKTISPFLRAVADSVVAKAIARTMAITHAVWPLPRPTLLAANCGATIHRLATQKAAAMVAHAMIRVVIATGSRPKRSMVSLNSLRKTAWESEVVMARMTNTKSVTTPRIAAKPSIISINGCEATQIPGAHGCAELKKYLVC